MQNTLTLSRNACAISPNELEKMCASKKACRTAGHPDELTTATAIAPKKTTVLTSAIATPRAP
jgi:hypothetical protein